MGEKADKVARDEILVRALAANAAFSGLSGLILVVAADPVSGWIGLEGGGWLQAIGIGLLLFAAGLVLLVRGRDRPRGRVAAVTAADLGWVAGSVVLLVGFPDLLTPAGEWAVGAVAVAVAGLATAQILGLRRREVRPRVEGRPPGESDPVSGEEAGPAGKASP